MALRTVNLSEFVYPPDEWEALAPIRRYFDLERRLKETAVDAGITKASISIKILRGIAVTHTHVVRLTTAKNEQFRAL